MISIKHLVFQVHAFNHQKRDENSLRLAQMNSTIVMFLHK